MLWSKWLKASHLSFMANITLLIISLHLSSNILEKFLKEPILKVTLLPPLCEQMILNLARLVLKKESKN